MCLWGMVKVGRGDMCMCLGLLLVNHPEDEVIIEAKQKCMEDVFCECFVTSIYEHVGFVCM